MKAAFAEVVLYVASFFIQPLSLFPSFNTFSIDKSSNLLLFAATTIIPFRKNVNNGLAKAIFAANSMDKALSVTLHLTLLTYRE